MDGSIGVRRGGDGMGWKVCTGGGEIGCRGMGRKGRGRGGGFMLKSEKGRGVEGEG